LKYYKKRGKEAIDKTTKQINNIVANSLANAWLFTEKIQHGHFLTAGRTGEN